MKITLKKMSLAGVLMMIGGLLILIINRLYIANCTLPCGYFDGARDVVIKIGIGLFLISIILLAYSTVRMLANRTREIRR